MSTVAGRMVTVAGGQLTIAGNQFTVSGSQVTFAVSQLKVAWYRFTITGSRRPSLISFILPVMRTIEKIVPVEFLSPLHEYPVIISGLRAIRFNNGYNAGIFIPLNRPSATVAGLVGGSPVTGDISTSIGEITGI